MSDPITLNFADLRRANAVRLPQFKNRHGDRAHASTDGSDWSVAQWLAATFGELGEFATVRTRYELGLMSREEYRVAAAKELADVATYLDILARRAFDDTHAGGLPDPSFELMDLIAILGEFANDRKKLDRGDWTRAQFKAQTEHSLVRAEAMLRWLRRHGDEPRPGTVIPHPDGVDLGRAVVDKFNEVSVRVKSTVFFTVDPRAEFANVATPFDNRKQERL